VSFKKNMLIISIDALFLTSAATLTGCGGSGVNIAGPASTSGALFGLAAYGSPIVEGVITIYEGLKYAATVSIQKTLALGARSKARKQAPVDPQIRELAGI